MKQIVLAYMFLVAGACIPDPKKSATQFVSALLGKRVTMPGSCYDIDEHNFDTNHSNANYAAQHKINKKVKRR